MVVSERHMTDEPRRRSRPRGTTTLAAVRPVAASAQATDADTSPAAPVEAAPDTTAPETPAILPRGRRSRRRSGASPAAPAAGASTTAGAAPPPSVPTPIRRAGPTRRRATGRSRPRESNILGLAERARLAIEPRQLLPLPDPLFVALPGIRQALLNSTLDDGLRAAAEALASALAPAVVQVWIADPAPWTSEQQRAGGLELAPALRPRAAARAMIPSAIEAETTPLIETLASGPLPRLLVRADPLVDEVATLRRPVVLFAADEHPLATEWTWRMPATPPAPQPVPSVADVARIGTLAAYPLRARGQFLGVLAVAARARLGSRHLSALEELADLAALAADRDRLLSYSRSQEALAQTVVRHTPVAIAVLTGPDHVFALTNPAFCPLLGVESEAQLIGRPLREALRGSVRSLAESLRLDAVYEGGEPQAMIELPIHLERGITYWNVTSSPLPGVSTSVAGVLVAAVDVTRQVQTRQRAQEAAEVAQERIGQMMTLHATSLAVASQLGADPRELLADILQRSISLLEARAGTVYVRDPRTNDLEVIVCQGLRGDYTGSRIRVGEGLTGRVAQTGKGMAIDDYRAYSVRTAIYDNEDFSAVIAVPLIQRGQVIGVLDVLDDADRRTFTDDDLWLLDLFAAQAAQAIENARTFVELEHAYRKQRELDRMKDDFIATASHELRTPLTGVQGFLDLLLDYPGSRDDELAAEFLQRASESAQELAEIAERLLQTSRLDAGRIELHMGPTRLATIVEEVLRSFRELQQAQGGTHELLSDVPPELYVHADVGRLKEVLDNLVGNAIKYSPQGGRVTVRCAPASFEGVVRAPASGTLHAGAIEERPTLVLPHVTDGMPDPQHDPLAPSPALVSLAKERPYLVITVSDEGMGIPAEERPRLFGRFARMDSARISQIRGTGLGLYICRQIVRAMGGDAWLQESEPGKGSTFAFALAAAAGVERDAPVESPPAAVPDPA
jgi:signal transduction histidine kinase